MALSCVDPSLLPSQVLALYRSEDSDDGSTITACEEECLFQVHSRFRELTEGRELAALSEIEEMGYDVEIDDAVCRSPIHQPIAIATTSGFWVADVFAVIFYGLIVFATVMQVRDCRDVADNDHEGEDKHAPWYMGEIP